MAKVILKIWDDGGPRIEHLIFVIEARFNQKLHLPFKFPSSYSIRKIQKNNEFGWINIPIEIDINEIKFANQIVNNMPRLYKQFFNLDVDYQVIKNTLVS